MVKSKLNIFKNTADNRGIALIMVLWILLLLMVIVLEFSFAMRVEVDATRNFKDETTCYYNARSGFQRAVVELIKDLAVKAEEEEGREGITWRADQRKITVKMSHGTAEIIIGDDTFALSESERKKKLLEAEVKIKEIISNIDDLLNI